MNGIDLQRRAILLGVPALALAPGQAFAASNLRAAFDYAYGPWEFTRAVARGVAARDGETETRFNRLLHRSTLSDHTRRLVTSPNNDTLYSAAYLELSGGPMILTMPTEKSRYHNVALMDLFTDNFAYLGTRETRGEGGTWWIVGPGWRGSVPHDVQLIRAPSNDVWLLARTLVDGPEDLGAATAFQNKLVLTQPPGRGPVREFTVSPSDPLSAQNLVSVVNSMLGRSMPLGRQASRVSDFRRWGLRPGAVDAFERLDRNMQEAWAAECAIAPARLRDRLEGGPVMNGWLMPERGLGNFGRNDSLRAAIALTGLAALDRNEGMYFSALTDSEGRRLDGTQAYRMSLPADVPVDAFWSVTMYQAEPDGRFFFVDNPIRRYSIGDRTRGLRRNSDGSLDVTLQSAPPTDEVARANWLPLPPQGPWRASFRAYLPHARMRNGGWAPPPLVRI